MPSINDLKNDGNAKQPFIPSISQEAEGTSTNLNDIKDDGSVGLVQGESVYSSEIAPVKKKVMSMTSGKVQRQKADLTQLPEGETPGVDLKESLEKEILGPGGVFDEYLADMTTKAKEDIDIMEAEQELNEASKTADESKEEKPKTEAELELEELEKEYEDAPVTKEYKTIDVFANDTSNEVNKMENEEVVLNEVEEKAVEVTESVDDEPIAVEEPVEDIEIERTITVNVETPDISDNDEDELEVDDSDADAIDEAEANRYVEIIRAEVSKRIKPVSKKMDISSFKIASKPSMSNNIITPKEVPIAKWALPATGITFQVKEFTGASIEKVRTAITNNQMNTVLQIIYDHIVSPKPASMEAWAKSIAFDDFDHLFFGVYIASFADSNFIQMTCDNKECKDKVFVTDNIPMMEMVKFKDTDVEKKFKILLSSDATNSNGLTASEVVPISENFAIGFVMPSIYAVQIENSYIDADFRTKYDTASAITPYIDNIYYIDKEKQELVPVGYKEYPNNKAKSVKSRIIRYDKVLQTLSMDEINLIRAYIVKIMEESQDVTYQIPAATCPHCGKQLNATTATASQILFSRNQLSLLVNT